MIRGIFIIISFILLSISFSCKESEPAKDSGFEYFPLKVGAVSLFSVDSTKYNLITNKKDSFRCFIKEIITEKKSDSLVDTKYRVECFISKDTSLGWSNYSYFFYEQSSYYINEVRGGKITTAFVFPVLKGRKWNINMFT